MVDHSKQKKNQGSFSFHSFSFAFKHIRKQEKKREKNHQGGKKKARNLPTRAEHTGESRSL